jgi:hypothetical protein
MPLCPTCVVEHTEEHYESNQKPAYVNLNDAMQDSRQRCYAAIVRLEELGRKNVPLCRARWRCRTIFKGCQTTSASSCRTARSGWCASSTSASTFWRRG